MQRHSLYQQELHPSPLGHTWREFKRSHVALLGLWCLLFFVLIAVFGSLFSPYDPILQNTNRLLIPPAWDASGSIAHLLGTDNLGRDMLSRLIHGARITFGLSLLLVVIALLVGVALGTMAGFTRGVRSSVLNHLLDALQAMPALLIAIIIVAILGTGLSNSMWAISLSLLPQFVHASRDFVRKELSKEYVLAARLDGAGNGQLFWFSVLPNMLEMLVVQGSMALATAILNLSALGFLNLGAQAPSPELGTMLSQGLQVAYLAPWNLFLPGITLFLMLLSVNLVGDGLRSALRNRLNH